jgi:hypothetical protein
MQTALKSGHKHIVKTLLNSGVHLRQEDVLVLGPNTFTKVPRKHIKANVKQDIPRMIRGIKRVYASVCYGRMYYFSPTS